MSEPNHPDQVLPEAPPAYSSIVVGVSTGNRPSLPEHKKNPHLPVHPTRNDPDALVVKFQTIVRDKKEIVVGRLKVQTGLAAPNEHAFILRRYDTSAISVTTMFKAAFPTASQEEEDREMRWIKSSFDMTGMNGGRSCEAVKLAGNWVPPMTAAHLAVKYRLGPWIEAMVNAQPVIGVKYRKSQRSQAASEEVAAPTGTDATTPARRAALANANPNDNAEHSDQPAAKRTRTADEEPSDSASGSGSNNAAGDETVNVTLTASSEIRAPAGTVIDAETQIAENRAMVLRMKEEALARSRAGESAEDLGLVDSSSASPSKARGTKRTAQVSADQEAVELSGGVAKIPAGAGAGVVSALKPNKEGREIRANKRIVKPEEATRKQAIWGGILLGAGAGLAYLASNFL